MKQEVTNQHQQVLYYLVNWDKFSLKDVILDSMFYKFQARLSEIELEHGSITNKTKDSFTNRFGRKTSYTLYECNDKEKALNLVESYSKRSKIKLNSKNE